MDAGNQDKLDELLDLTRENNKILRSMHRRFVWGQVFTFIYWLIILGVTGWAYVYFQPYIEEYMNAYKTIMASIEQMKEASEGLPALKDLIPGGRQ